MALWAALISVALALSQTPVITLRDHGYGASASRGVPVYVPAVKPVWCGVKEDTPKSSYFTIIGSFSVKTVADRHRHAAYHNKH